MGEGFRMRAKGRRASAWHYAAERRNELMNVSLMMGRINL